MPTPVSPAGEGLPHAPTRGMKPTPHSIRGVHHRHVREVLDHADVAIMHWPVPSSGPAGLINTPKAYRKRRAGRRSIAT